MAKGKKQKAGKSREAPQAVSLKAHPRAARSIRLVKGYVGLGACLFAGYVSWRAGTVLVDVALRALLWGVAAYMLAWALSVQVWRHLVIAEVRAAERRWRERGAAVSPDSAQLTSVLGENASGTSS